MRKEITELFTYLLNTRNSIPGMGYTQPTHRCCGLDREAADNSYYYEPGYITLENDKIHIFSPIYSNTTTNVCSKTHAKLKSSFEQFDLFKNTNFSFIPLYSSRTLAKYFDKAKNKLNFTDDVLDSSMEAYCKPHNYLIFNSDNTKLLCISMDDWIYPLTTEFISLDNSINQKMLLGWNLTAIHCREDKGKYIIQFENLQRIAVNKLIQSSVELKMIDSSLFSRYFTVDYTASLIQYISDAQKFSLINDKSRAIALHSLAFSYEYIHYIACLMICVCCVTSITSLLKRRPEEEPVNLAELHVD